MFVSERLARPGVIAAMLALSALAWLWLYPIHTAPRVGALFIAPPMNAMPWSVGKALFMFAMWSVMMAGMMIPSAIPMTVAVERMARGRGARHATAVATAFVLAYIVVWTAFSIGATAAQFAAEHAGLMSMTMASASAWLSGLVLIGAGLFQFTPLKRACLSRCRSPMGFLLTEWRPGIRGNFITGLRHGVYCVGCCWGLMASLFVFGTMNLVAAASLAVLVLAEKVFPGGLWIARLSGIGFIAVGGAVLLKSLG